MKPRTKIVLVGALLIALAALSAMKRGARSNSDAPNAGACCPFALAPGLLPMLSGTNPSAINASTNSSPATGTLTQQVIAYYFHGTVRCETCLKIEQQAKAELERQLKTELDTQHLVFKSVNYDLPENAHFLFDYKLPCPSLVLVRQKDGKDEKWALLSDIWTLVDDPVKFNDYIQTETRKFLKAD
jgi:hypothetical protein